MATLSLPSNELTEFDLPRVCVLTGETDGVVFKDVKFQWYPRWTMALILINVLVAAVVAMALTKKVKGKLPFTEASFAAWRTAVLLRGLSIFGCIVLLIGGGVLMAVDMAVLGLLAFVAAIALPIAVHYAKVKGRMITCTRIADGKIDLTIPSESAALTIRQHLHAGALRPAAALPVA